MKKLMALVLSLGLVLLGTAPVMAAGQAATCPAKAHVAQPVTLKTTQLDLNGFAVPEPPSSSTLTDDDLENTQGEWGWAVAGAIVGAYKAVKSCDNCSLVGKVAAGFTGAVVGATVGAYAAAGALVSETVGAIAGTVAGIAGYHAVKTSVDNIKKATGR